MNKVPCFDQSTECNSITTVIVPSSFKIHMTVYNTNVFHFLINKKIISKPYTSDLYLVTEAHASNSENIHEDYIAMGMGGERDLFFVSFRHKQTKLYCKLEKKDTVPAPKM